MQKRIQILMFLLAAFLSGCAAESKGEEESDIAMPANMPIDFDFKIAFGLQKNNEINTYEDTLLFSFPLYSKE